MLIFFVKEVNIFNLNGQVKSNVFLTIVVFIFSKNFSFEASSET